MRIPTFLHYRYVIKHTVIKTFFLLALLMSSFTTFSQQIAFPSVKGAGAYITGGRGGQVIHVTTLNATGPGSFVEALQTTGPRIIVFDVGGTIDLTGAFGRYDAIISGAAYGDLTIAGHTAPGGILIESQKIYFDQVPNVIWRYVSFSHWQASYNTYGDDVVYMNSPKQVFDNCSFAWGLDETISIFEDKAIGEVTIQSNMMVASKTGLILGAIGGPHGGFTVVDNLWAGISHRFPNLGSKNDDRYDIINNSIYGHTARLVTIAGSNDGPGYHTNDQDVNYIGNYVHPSGWLLGLYGGNWPQNKLNIISEYLADPDFVDIYSSMNYIKGYRETPQANDDDMWTNFDWNYGGTNGAYEYTQLQEGPWFTDTQHPLIGQGFPIKTAEQAWIDNLENAGANKYLSDTHSIVSYRTETDQLWYDRAKDDTLDRNAGWLESELNFGYHTGFSRPANWDTDGDGMPDTWEDTKTEVGSAVDNSSYVWASGYVGVEEYLNLIDGDIEIVDAAGVTVTPQTATVNIPETLAMTVTFEPVNTTNQSGTWTSSNPAVATIAANGTVTPVSPGQTTITFNSNDGGFSDSGTITVTDNPIDVESVSLSPETLDLNLYATATLVAEILPTNATDITGTWTSSDPSIATVNQEGLVQPVAIGVTTITFTTNNSNLSANSIVTVNNDQFGSYEFYNADTDQLIQLVEGGEVFDLDDIGENLNFRVIPLGGDNNPEVESVGIEWNGVEAGNYGESSPLYAGMTEHIGNDYQPYTVEEGVYNFTVTYYSENSQAGNVVATDNFNVTFLRGSQVNAGEDSSICQGDTVALIASGADSYLWSTGETSETIAVTPDVTTTYTVTGTHSDGNTTEDSVIVTVNELPTVNAGIDQTICEGESIVLTATVSVGSITWSTGETTSSITVSPTVTTTYTVTSDNNECSSTDDVIVNVVALPTANAGNDVTIINGGSTTLNASGGGEYLWSTGETSSSIVVSPIVDTAYTVIITNDSGCTSEDTVNVTVVDAIVANAGDDVAICEGESTTLTATGGDNYVWSTGETTQSIIVNPIETTSYSVTVSNQSASDTDNVTVTVLEQPVAEVSNDITISSGESTILIATGGDNYEWSNGETTDTITVSPTVSTTYTVTVSNTNGCSDIATVTVTVIEPVVADAGEDVAICEGESVTLNASGGDSYLWNTGETTQSIIVNPENTTNYSVTVSNANSSDTDSVLVTVNPIPVVDAGNDVTINQGDSVTLYASGGNTYLWSTGDTNANISVSPTETTIYSVTTTINGCSDTDEVTVTVIQLVNASAGDDQTICQGESITLTATGGDTYEWSSGENTQTITVSPDSTTDYTVTVNTTYGSDSDDVRVNVEQCGLENFEFKTFPNPSNGFVNAKISGLSSDVVVQVADILGNQLKYIEVEANGGQTIRFKVDLRGMVPGMYLITLYGDNRTVTRKLILK